MELEIKHNISFNENQKDFRKNTNANTFELFCTADSNDIPVVQDPCGVQIHGCGDDNTNPNYAIKDFKIDNVNKFVFDLKVGNTFDTLIMGDILRLDSIDELASLHIFCYESTSIRPFKIPIRFDVIIEDAAYTLGSMSEFSLGNVRNITSDIRINNIVVPSDSKATLVIIAATKEN